MPGCPKEDAAPLFVVTVPVVVVVVMRAFPAKALLGRVCEASSQLLLCARRRNCKAGL